MGSIRLASIDADMRVVVHVDAFEEGITAHGLAEVLGITVDEIFSALPLASNAGFCTSFYQALRSADGPYVEQPGPDNTMYTLELLPAVDLDQDEQVTKMLELEMATQSDFGHWPLPRANLVLPMSHDVFLELDRSYGFGRSRRRQLEVHDADGQAETVRRLEKAVERLEKELRTAAERTREHGGTLAGLEKARGVVFMQERHWWSQAKKGEEPSASYQAHRERLARLDTALLALGGKLVERLRTPHEAKMAGWELLKILRDRSAPHGGIPALLEILAVARWNVHSELRTQLLRLVRRAVSALTISPVAEDFMRQHGLDLLEAHCRDGSNLHDQLIAQLDSDRLANELRAGWADTLTTLRMELRADDFGKSPLVHVATIAKAMRSTLAISRAVLTPTTMGLLLTALHRHAKSPAAAGRGIAVVTLRFLTASSIPHLPATTPPPRVVREYLTSIAQRDDEWLVAVLLDEADGLSGTRLLRHWRRAGKQLADRHIHKHYLRSRPVTGTFLTLNLVILAASIGGDKREPFTYTLALLAGILGTAQAAAGVAQHLLPYEARFVGSPQIGALDNASTRLGRAAGVLGLAASVAALANHPATEADAVLVVEYLNVTSGALTAFGWLFEIAGSMSLATGLGVAGAVIGCVALGAAIIVDLTTAGPGAVVKAYVDYIADDEEGNRFPIEIDEVAKAIKDVDDAYGFANFPRINGYAGIDPLRTSPTLYGAMRLGFSHLEIAKLFNENLAYVAGVLPTEAELA